MVDLSLKAGSSRTYSLTIVDDDGVPVSMTTLTAAAWLILKGTTVVKTKTVDAGDIWILNATGYDISNNIVPQLLVVLPSTDTDAVTGLGSKTETKMYKHELWLYFSDGTQDCPQSFAGRFTITPSVGNGVMA